MLFPDPYFFQQVGPADFDVLPDGRFLMIKEGPFAAPGQISVVRNWVEELKERVPVDGSGSMLWSPTGAALVAAVLLLGVALLSARRRGPGSAARTLTKMAQPPTDPARMP